MQELEKYWKMEEEPGRGGEFLLAVGAGEVVRVVDLAAEPQRLTVCKQFLGEGNSGILMLTF